MYNWEIEKFLKERNYYIGGDDLLKVISILENPQLTYIKRCMGEGEGETEKCIYYMKAKGDFNPNEEIEFKFCAMPYEEAKVKGLVKKNKNC